MPLDLSGLLTYEYFSQRCGGQSGGLELVSLRPEVGSCRFAMLLLARPGSDWFSFGVWFRLVQLWSRWVLWLLERPPVTWRCASQFGRWWCSGLLRSSMRVCARCALGVRLALFGMRARWHVHLVCVDRQDAAAQVQSRLSRARRSLAAQA